MNKKILLLSLLWFNCFVFAQERMGSFENDLKTSSGGIKEVIPVVDQKTDALSLFFMDAKKVYGYLLNSELEVVMKFTLMHRLM